MHTQTALHTLLSSAMIAALIGAFSIALPQAAQAQQGQTCDLDIALVLDSSGSIDSSDLTSMQDSFDSFVDSMLAAEPGTEMTVVDFDASASIEQDWTGVAADIKDGIDNGSSGGSTNWEDAINTAQDQFPHRTANNPDVMIFASDGNPNEPGDDANALSVAQTAAGNAKSAGTFIKAIGIGDSIDGANLDSISSDGSHIDSDFDQLESDLLSLASTLCEEVTEETGGGGDVTVVNNNTATVTNTTGAEAKTGKNEAGGSTGGDGGDGGAVENDGGNQNVSGSGTGTGGRGGNAGSGGTVFTGNALAEAATANVVNSNMTRINRCACNGDDTGDTTVRNRNHAAVFNGTFARAKTGYNAADGSAGGTGGSGGDIENDTGRKEETGQNVNNSTTGDGGHGGSSASGGWVETGSATARAETRTVVDRNTTRILR